MNIREMIGQRLVFGFKGTELPQEFTELVRKFKLGNVILFRYNVENTAQLSRLCTEIQELVRRETGHPAFITIDQEGGMVTRLPADAGERPRQHGHRCDGARPRRL
ncbi:MAG: glycoside hydrolase family 3 N-terminal domain-containing protein [Oscillospiraceae bacterium]